MPRAVKISLHQASGVLEIEFDDAKTARLSCEYLRVYSPSAEVRGHGPGQGVLQSGKREVGIERIEAVGNYAIRPTFSDGHRTGIYTWAYLYELMSNQDDNWRDYLQRLQQAGLSRES